MSRRSPYGVALTLDEYRDLEPGLTRPITDPHMHPRHIARDARRSGLTTPRWRPPQQIPEPEESAA